MNHKPQIKQLREQIPIGLKQAIALLHETAGDLDQAISLFKRSAIKAVITKTSLSESQSLQLLEQHGFDISSAIHTHEQNQFTLTENIFRKNKNKTDALCKLLVVLIEYHQLKVDFFLTTQQIETLPPYQQTFMLIMDWHNYFDWETFDCTLSHRNIKQVVDAIQHAINYPLYADKLSQAQQHYQLLKASHPHLDQHADYLYFHNQIFTEDQIIKTNERFLIDQSDNLMEHLYRYVQDNITHFP